MNTIWKVLFWILGILILLIVGGAGTFFYFIHFDKPIQGQIANNLSGCDLENDNYSKPDFNLVKQTLLEQEMVKEFPESGSISLSFIHIFGNCKVYDKIFLISRNNVEEKNDKGDVDIEINSDYAKRINEGLCNVVKEARDTGAIQETLNINAAQLAWKYSGMLKYRSCFGI